MRPLFAVIVLFFLSSHSAFAQHTSKDSLLKAFQQAYAAQDKDKFMVLYYWEGLDKSMQEMVEDTIDQIYLKEPAVDVVFEPLDTGKKSNFELNSYRYSPNVELQGYITVIHSQSESSRSTAIPFGSQNSQFFLSAMKREKLEGKSATQHQMSVSIMGHSNTDTPIQFGGEITFSVNGTLTKKDLSGKNNISHSFWADNIEDCTVFIAAGRGELEVRIYDNDEKIFEQKTPSSKPVNCTPKHK